jgi:type IV pilus assembly protein PilC
MPIFEYEAKTLQGAKLKGKMEAMNKENAFTNLRMKGYYPVNIREYKESLNLDIAMLEKVKLKDISIFCRQFSVVIGAGISILKGLAIVKEQTESKKLKKILEEVFDDVQKGKALSEAMKKHKEFPEMLSNMITVGEASGTLDLIMDRMAIFYEKENKLNQKIKGAMTYPMTIGIISLGVVILLITKVLPVFIGMLNGAALPLPTRILLGISNFLTSKWYLAIAIVTILIISIRAFNSSPRGKYFGDKFKMNAPIFGKIYRKIVTAKFARTFGILMSSGVPLINSIEICADVVGNVIIKEVLESTKDEIKKGLSIGETLESRHVFPPMLTQMIKIGEESGTLDSILDKTAEFYDGEVDTATAQLTALIEPLIIVVLAVVVGFIIVSIILPMFAMYSAVGKG